MQNPIFDADQAIRNNIANLRYSLKFIFPTLDKKTLFTTIPKGLQNLQLKDITLTSVENHLEIHSSNNKVSTVGKLSKDQLGIFGLTPDNFKKDLNDMKLSQPTYNLKKAIENIIATFNDEILEFYITPIFKDYSKLYEDLKKLNPSKSKKTIIETLYSTIPVKEEKKEDKAFNAQTKKFRKILDDSLNAIYIIEEFSLKTKDKTDAQDLVSQLQTLITRYFPMRLTWEVKSNKNNLSESFNALKQTKQ